VSDLIPLFPLELVLFPDTPFPLHIFETRYKEMIGECLKNKSEFGMVRTIAEGDSVRMADYGCTAEIIDVMKTYPDGRMDIFVCGRKRFELLAVNEERSFLQGRFRFAPDEPPPDSSVLPELRAKAFELNSEVALLMDIPKPPVEPDDANLSFHLSALLPVDLDFKQSILETPSEEQRLRTLLDYYYKVLPKMKSIVSDRVRSGGQGYVN
jgi:Lon protease-like protein